MILPNSDNLFVFSSVRDAPWGVSFLIQHPKMQRRKLSLASDEMDKAVLWEAFFLWLIER